MSCERLTGSAQSTFGTPKGKRNRSRFMDQAIRELALGRTRAQVRKLLEEEGRVSRVVRAGEGGCRGDSTVLARQIRCVDHARLVRRLGKLRPG